MGFNEDLELERELQVDGEILSVCPLYDLGKMEEQIYFFDNTGLDIFQSLSKEEGKELLTIIHCCAEAYFKKIIKNIKEEEEL